MVDPAVVKEHRRVSEVILRHLCNVRTQKGRHYPWHLLEDNDIPVPMWSLQLVLQILLDDGLAEPFPSLKGAYCITPTGIQQLNAWDDETAPALELVKIEALSPQPRGKGCPR